MMCVFFLIHLSDLHHKTYNFTGFNFGVHSGQVSAKEDLHGYGACAHGREPIRSYSEHLREGSYSKVSKTSNRSATTPHNYSLLYTVDT